MTPAVEAQEIGNVRWTKNDSGSKKSVTDTKSKNIKAKLREYRKEGEGMGHTYSNNLFHIIFSTKDRIGLIDDSYRQEVHSYLGGVAQNLDCNVLIVNSVIDHVHLLCKIKSAISVSDFVNKLKSNSSRWMKERFDLPFGFGWQSGFSCFTVSESAVEDVKRYIEGQPEHHKKVSYAEELKAFLQKNGIAYDPEHYLD